jgi:hypothetical protein
MGKALKSEPQGCIQHEKKLGRAMRRKPVRGYEKT